MERLLEQPLHVVLHNVFKKFCYLLCSACFLHIFNLYNLTYVDFPINMPKMVFWGKEQFLDPDIKSFSLEFTDEQIDAIKERLRISLPNVTPSLEGSYNQRGINNEPLKEFVDYVTNRYNWTERLQYFNHFKHYKINIHGLRVHYVHYYDSTITNPHYKMSPILLLHGFGSSFVEYLTVAEQIVKLDHFKRTKSKVVIVSLPGFGFSEATHKMGMGTAEIAVMMRMLMLNLGYNSFTVHGSGWGGVIADQIGILFPQNVFGIHSTSCSGMTASIFIKLIIGLYKFLPNELEKQNNSLMEKVYPIRNLFYKLWQEEAQSHFQATKPDTLGVALGDSPIGLAAYLLDRFIITSNFKTNNSIPTQPNLMEIYNYNLIVDTFFVYQLTNSITTAMRLDAETLSEEQRNLALYKVPVIVPTVCVALEDDLYYYPESLLRDKYENLLEYVYRDGGKFQGFSKPYRLAEDISSAVTLFHNSQRQVTVGTDPFIEVQIEEL